MVNKSKYNSLLVAYSYVWHVNINGERNND